MVNASRLSILETARLRRRLTDCRAKGRASRRVLEKMTKREPLPQLPKAPTPPTYVTVDDSVF